MVKSFILIFLVFASVNSTCQDVYKTSDGFKVKIVSNIGDDCNKVSVFGGALGPEGFNNFGVKYLDVKKRFMVNLLVGITGGMIDGNFFLRKKVKTIEKNQVYNIMKTGPNTSTGSKAKFPHQIVSSSGPHLGILSTNHSKSLVQYDAIKTEGIVVGWSFLISRYIHIEVEHPNGQFYQVRNTLFNRINIDFVTYFSSEITSSNLKKEPTPNKVGGRIYLDGTATSLSKGRFSISLNYMVGIGVNARSESVELPLIGGFGIGLSF
jgi:hypothetical protein